MAIFCMNTEIDAKIGHIGIVPTHGRWVDGSKVNVTDGVKWNNAYVANFLHKYRDCKK